MKILLKEPRFGTMTIQEIVYKKNLFPHVNFRCLTKLKLKDAEELESDYMRLLYDKCFITTHRTEIVMEYQDLLPYYDFTECRNCDVRKKLNVIRRELIARNAKIGYLAEEDISVPIEKPKPKRKAKAKRKAPAKKKTKK